MVSTTGPMFMEYAGWDNFEMQPFFTALDQQ